jgi:hypothetical protein
MVGAGLSRCAEKSTPNAPDFPLWAELATALYANLYPQAITSNSIDEKRRIQLTAGGGALRLASEYETVFGRQALDALVETSIPNDSYSPGKVHKILLSLPWSDVFTTNYDTLLERTRPFIYDRKYDLILTSADIPGRMEPRIVKLHGSFPSHRPYILTEEDFRIYPRHYAPFVNMVQESIMENALCLLGFSGDDPNFLHWSGWVRDNLGSATPPIYLCGLLNLSPSQRKLLERRSVILIDMSPLFPEEVPNRHAKATEWFLLNLLYGQAPPRINWPDMSINHAWGPSDGLNVLVPTPLAPSTAPSTSSLFPWQPFDDQQLLSLVAHWRESRLRYPGWIIAPHTTRDKIWHDTVSWIDRVLSLVAQLEPPYDLTAMFELHWRLNLVGVPTLPPWIGALAPIVSRYNPFPKEASGQASVVRGMEQHEHLDWEHIGECWVALNFEVIRFARYTQSDAHLHGLAILKPVVAQSADLYCKWNYERCLFHLYRSDLDNLRTCLKEWAEVSQTPPWQARRACLLAEIGEIDEAVRLANEALDGTRSQLQPGVTDYALLSQEGLIMLLLQRLNRRVSDPGDNRSELLARHRCNANDELQALLSSVAQEAPSDSPVESQTRQFDPGRVTYSFNMKMQMPALEQRHSYALVRIAEEAGIPFRIGNHVLFQSELSRAARHLVPVFPLWSLGLTLRYDDHGSLEERYTRAYIAALSSADLSQLFETHFEAVSRLVPLLTPDSAAGVGSTAARRARLHCELLSRICLRLDGSRLDQLLRLAATLYARHELMSADVSLAQTVNSLFSRVLSSMTEREICAHIPFLLSIPVIDTPAHGYGGDPFLLLRLTENIAGSQLPDRDEWGDHVPVLIDLLRHGGPTIRKTALARLDVLHRFGALNEAEVGEFADALWCRTNVHTGLPTDTSFYKSAYLRLPEPVPGRAKRTLHDYLLNLTFPKIAGRITKPDGTVGYSFAIRNSMSEMVQNLIYATRTPTIRQQSGHNFIDWTHDEAVDMFGKAVAFWDDQKEALQTSHMIGMSMPIGNLAAALDLLLVLVFRVIFPRMAGTSDYNMKQVLRLIDEMDGDGFRVERALPGVLFVAPDQYGMVAERIRRSLYAGAGSAVEAAVWGLFDWQSYAASHVLKAPPSDLLEIPFVRLASRASVGLLATIDYASQVLRSFPKSVRKKHVELACLALEFLLAESATPTEEGYDQRSSQLEIDIAERPELRAMSSKLAKSLFDYFVSRGAGTAPIVDSWKSASLADPLPEVRHVWQD